MQYRVLVAIPTYSWQLDWKLVKYLDWIAKHLPAWSWLAKAYGVRTPIHQCRNMFLEKMLEWNFTHLIMLDDDELPEDDNCFKNLLEADKDMVSGIVRYRMKKEDLSICKTEPRWEWTDTEWMVKYDCYHELPQKWLFKIDNCWCWLICLTREVVEKMMKVYANHPFESKQTVYVKQTDWKRVEFWFHNPSLIAVKENWIAYLCRRELSEDYLFFERAQSLWFELRANGDCKVIHYWTAEEIKV